MLYLVQDLLARSLRLAIEVGPGGRAHTDYTRQKQGVDEAKARATAAEQAVDADAGQAAQDLAQIRQALVQDHVRDHDGEATQLRDAEQLIASGKPADLKQAAKLLKDVAAAQSTRLEERLEALRDPARAEKLSKREKNEAEQATRTADRADEQLRKLQDKYQDAGGKLEEAKRQLADRLSTMGESNWDEPVGDGPSFRDAMNTALGLAREGTDAQKEAKAGLYRAFAAKDPGAAIQAIQALREANTGNAELSRALDELMAAKVDGPAWYNYTLNDVVRDRKAVADRQADRDRLGQEVGEQQKLVNKLRGTASVEAAEATTAARDVDVARAYAEADAEVKDRQGDVSRRQQPHDKACQELQGLQQKLRDADQQPHDVGASEQKLRESEHALEAARTRKEEAQDRLDKANSKAGELRRAATDAQQQLSERIAAMGKGNWDEPIGDGPSFRDAMNTALGLAREGTDAQKEAKNALYRAFAAKDPEATIKAIQGLSEANAGNAELMRALDQLMAAKVDGPGWDNFSLNDIARDRAALTEARQRVDEQAKDLPALKAAVSQANQEIGQGEQAVKGAHTELETARKNHREYERLREQTEDKQSRVNDLARELQEAQDRLRRAEAARDAVVPARQ